MKKNEAGLYEVEIDDHKYEFEKWGAEDSLDTLIDMASIIGGPLGAALMKIFDKKKTEDKNALDKELNLDSLSVAFDSLAKNMRKETVKPLIKKFCSDKVLCDGKKFKFNDHYQDRLGHMFAVAKAGMEVQYQELFVVARGAKDQLKRARATIQELQT